jgi:hypothetical protein
VHIPPHIAEHIDVLTGLTDMFDYNHERKTVRRAVGK